MNWLTELLSNPWLLCPVTSWLVAQVLKVIINAIIHKKLDWERLVGDGGMPSGHSATVSSLAMFALLKSGPGSFEFAVCAILAIIVCHDAMGVRWETGKQAQAINEIIRTVEVLSKQDLPEVKLKELVGHTPVQVLAGITIGICNALLFFFVIL
ncbi:MAG: divergent PAP2 family protein [Clostridia bacterium]|nr:divergent PAP2 family protein [Clostridia bacterium]MBR6573824.1 divergent PAP2 family protein [Clostridia bacterium]